MYAIFDLWPLSQWSHSAVSDNERSNLVLSSTVWLAAVSSICKFNIVHTKTYHMLSSLIIVQSIYGAGFMTVSDECL